MLVADLHFHYLEVARQILTVATRPLQEVAALPVRFAGNASRYFSTLVEVQQENASLRHTQLEVSQQLLRYSQLEQENVSLRQLLKMAQTVQGRSIAADILYDGPDPFARRVILDCGTAQGVEAGLAVIDENGFLGQITRVYPVMSEVTLISDKELVVPVQIERSGQRGMLFGGSHGRGLELRFMQWNADIRVGDRLVTSGLDGLFLPGIPVAEVVEVQHLENEDFLTVFAKPLARAGSARQVLVVGRENAAKPVTGEIE